MVLIFLSNNPCQKEAQVSTAWWRFVQILVVLFMTLLWEVIKIRHHCITSALGWNDAVGFITVRLHDFEWEAFSKEIAQRVHRQYRKICLRLHSKQWKTDLGRGMNVVWLFRNLYSLSFRWLRSRTHQHSKGEYHARYETSSLIFEKQTLCDW